MPVQHGGRDHPRAQAIIQVMGGVSQLIGHVGDLGFQVAAQLRIEVGGIGRCRTRTRA